MLCLSGFELYYRWVPLAFGFHLVNFLPASRRKAKRGKGIKIIVIPVD